ncbi:MAG TPA: hypothetical protein HA326_01055 [Thermoplasmata archaeon]|nr:hypothetical protein [Thermoplasmata archaeon]
MKGRTRAVSKEKYVIYMKRSSEFQSIAETAMDKGFWDVAVANAVHAGISMADALAVYYLGLRSAAQEHGESIQLLYRIGVDRKELERNTKHLTDLLDVKSLAEYEERSLKSDDAEVAVKKSKRFRVWATAKLPR